MDAYNRAIVGSKAAYQPDLVHTLNEQENELVQGTIWQRAQVADSLIQYTWKLAQVSHMMEEGFRKTTLLENMHRVLCNATDGTSWL